MASAGKYKHIYECIRAYYATIDSDEEDVILCKKGTAESEYNNDLDDGDD